MKSSLSFTLISLLSFASPVLSQSNRSDNQSIIADESTALIVVEAINRHELGLADSLLAIRLQADPNSLQWLFLRGMRYYADIYVGTAFDENTLSMMEQSLKKVVELGEQRLDKNENDLVALFYAGGAYGYLGIAYGAHGSIFSGVGAAKDGYKMHQKLIKLYPECYDAYLGPGLMNLMTSAVPLILKPILYLFGLSGTEEKAYEYLSLAYTKGKLGRLEAGLYLAQVHGRRKEFQQASQIYSELTRKYPMRIGLCAESTSPLWNQHRYNDIIVNSVSTMQTYESGKYSLTRGDSAWLPSIFVNCAMAHEDLGDTTAAINVLKSFFSRRAYQNIASWRIHLRLGDLYLARKETLLAEEHYRSVLNSDAYEKTKDRVRKVLDDLGEAHK